MSMKMHNPSIAVTFSYSFSTPRLSELMWWHLKKIVWHVCMYVCAVYVFELENVSPQETHLETCSHRLLFLMDQPAERRRSLQQLPHVYLCVLNKQKLTKEPLGLAQVAPVILPDTFRWKFPLWHQHAGSHCPLAAVAAAIVCQCGDECFIMGWLCCWQLTKARTMWHLVIAPCWSLPRAVGGVGPITGFSPPGYCCSTGDQSWSRLTGDFWCKADLGSIWPIACLRPACLSLVRNPSICPSIVLTKFPCSSDPIQVCHVALC